MPPIAEIDLRRDLPKVREQLLELAERVEALAGPDRETDGDIHALLFGCKTGKEFGLAPACWEQRYFRDPEGGQIYSPIPLAFTAEVSAAERALPGPEWPEWQITRRYGTGYHANVGLSRDRVGCESPALALTAAALRARAGAV